MILQKFLIAFKLKKRKQDITEENKDGQDGMLTYCLAFFVIQFEIT